MFDIQKILKRSWHILWSYRMLWVFGFLLALATSFNSPGNSSRYTLSDNRQDRQVQLPQDWEGLKGDTFGEVMADAWRQLGLALDALRARYPVEFRMGINAAITLFVVLLLSGIVVAVLRYVAEASTIHMVDEYEQSGVKVGLRQAWRYGWSRSAWRLFLSNLVAHLPVFALLVVLALVTWWVLAAIFSTSRSVGLSGLGWGEAATISTFIAGSGLAFLAIFTTVIVMAVLLVVRDFAWRKIVLEDAGAGAALGEAWSLLKRQWKNIGVTWLVMAGIRILWIFVFFLLVFPLMAVSLITAFGGLAVALVPSLLAAGFASLLSAPSYWPWVFALIVGLPLFFIITFSPLILVSGWARIYQSSVWTLAFRELKALEAVQNGELPAGEPEDAPPQEIQPV